MDRQWFQERVVARFGSQRGLARAMELDQSNVSRMLSGLRPMTLAEARWLSRELRAPIVEILLRAGAITAADVTEWAKSRERK